MSARGIGPLALRIGVGGTWFAHCTQNRCGWFGGTGLEETGAMFEQLGFRPGKGNAIAAGLGEVGGGALLAAGLGTPGAAAAVAGTMSGASSVHAASGVFNSSAAVEVTGGSVC